jgi:hypothetical protein
LARAKQDTARIDASLGCIGVQELHIEGTGFHRVAVSVNKVASREESPDGWGIVDLVNGIEAAQM